MHTTVDTTTLTALEGQVTALVRRADRWRAAVAAAVRTSGTSPADRVHADKAAYAVLGLLSETGPVRLSEVAAALHLDTSTVSRHIAGLEAAGLVARLADPRDGRACLLSPTEAGSRRLDTLRGERATFMAQALASWSDEEITTLIELLGRLNADVERRLAAPATPTSAS